MSWLKEIPGRLYDDALSLAPHALAADADMAAGVKAGLEPRRYAIIGLAVAGCLGCERFVDALRGPLDIETARQVCLNWREAGLDEQEQAVLAFTEKGTLDESSVTEDNVQALRDAGLSDEEILSVTAAVSYQNYALRVAAALGLDPRLEASSA